MSATTHLLDQAQALREAARPLEALSLLRKAVQTSPEDADLLHALGNTLRSQGLHKEALQPLQTAVALKPGNAIFQLNLGVTLLELARRNEALAAFEAATALAPWMPEAHNITACALTELGRPSEAEAKLREALRLRPAYPAAFDNLGRCLRAQGRMPEALECFEQALRLKASPSTHSNALMALNYLPGLPARTLAERHRDWGRRHADRLAPRPDTVSAPRSARSSRLRLGYVSGDFCNHAVSFFIAPVLAHHDKSRFEVTCYHTGQVSDDTTARLRGLSEQWREIGALGDEEAAALVRKDGIDILVDLSGHTAGNRLLVFARRPAPVQITWLGYPNTTGVTGIDWRISDSCCLPPSLGEDWGTERILRMPGPFCCYEAPTVTPPVTSLPPLSHTQPPVFCSFNNIAKLSAPCLALWARLLRAVPGSTLLLKSPGAGDPGTGARLRAALEAHGVSGERLHLHGRPLPLAEHLALYQGCHVALDPFPYNGTTTTCEALLMGVPVVTLAGQAHASRVGASLLHWVGMDTLIAQDEHDYLEAAVNLVSDLPRLACLRSSLRQRLLEGPLCNARLFTHHLESALLRLATQSA